MLLTVTVAATNTALVSLDRVKRELGINDTASDKTLQDMIADASAAVAHYLGRPLARETVQETVRMTRGGSAYDVWNVAGGTPRMLEYLILARRPVVSVASVMHGDTALDVSSEIELDRDNGILWRLSNDVRAPWTARKAVVTYTAGYWLPDDSADATGWKLPGDFQRAALIAVVAWWSARGRDPQLRSESVDQVGSASYLDPRAGDGGLPAQAAELLALHRAPGIA